MITTPRAATPALLALLLTTSSLPALAATPPAQSCANVSSDSLKMVGVTGLTAQTMPADATLPAHCLIKGQLGQRTGTDGQPYAISFELRLPDTWNGRFFHQVNGGNDGKVVPATGGLLSGNKSRQALPLGYAVLSSDAGHNGEANPQAGLTGGNLFGRDPQARLDYGYQAVAKLTPMAKAALAAYYGTGPAYSYMVGCSNGGRHGLVAASRMGEAYDGILAGAPGFNLPKSAVQHAWDVQSFQQANPDIRKAFSKADLAAVAGKVRQSCDALDGATDGIVGDLAACQKAFDPKSLTCTPGQTEGCLSAAQTTALARSLAGPVNSKGEALYSDWAWDTGIGGDNWRFWKLESTVPPWGNLPVISVMGAGSLSYIFTTPPTETQGKPEALISFLAGFDFDRDASKIYATDGAFGESAMDFMTPPDATNPRLEALRAAGHKLIVFHGNSDPVFSVKDTIAWYEKLDANADGKAESFAKLYPVPGMTHCSAGPATDDFDLFSSLVTWVEQGTAPGAVVASVRADNKELPADWSKTRTRPLCPWPQVARYSGSGSLEDAANFRCE